MSQITWDHHHHLGLGAPTFSLLLGTRSFQSRGSWGGGGGDQDPSTVTNFDRLCCWENTLNVTIPFLVNVQTPHAERYLICLSCNIINLIKELLIWGLSEKLYCKGGDKRKKRGKSFDTVEMNKRLRHLTFLSPLKSYMSQ